MSRKDVLTSLRRKLSPRARVLREVSSQLIKGAPQALIALNAEAVEPDNISLPDAIGNLEPIFLRAQRFNIHQDEIKQQLDQSLETASDLRNKPAQRLAVAQKLAEYYANQYRRFNEGGKRSSVRNN